jgi:aminoglycoside phosphotransferase (APT) family kinase protein
MAAIVGGAAAGVTYDAAMTAASGPTDNPDGIDVGRVTDWLSEQRPDLSAPFRFEKLPGGHSNFTYLVHDAGARRFVLRRPPLGELLPSAHDMTREYRIISALWSTPVPVPEPIAFCDDLAVTGARFYCMGAVDGKSLYEGADVEAQVPQNRRQALGRSFIDVLADLHALEPDEIGLGDLGRKDDYVGRQLKRWFASWNASQTPDSAALTDVAILHDELVARLPQQGPARLVHGDYGLHNTLSHRDGYIAAVIDWEISTLGDPLADLAYALNTWIGPEDPPRVKADVPTLEPGFPTRRELADRYASRTGQDLSSLPYYSAFNHWKTVCILQGVYARYLQGQKSTEGVDLPLLAARRDESLWLARRALESV